MATPPLTDQTVFAALFFGGLALVLAYGWHSRPRR